MTTAIKPIETRYHGYTFRSRLEARWAVFFDTMGVPYRYETEGFVLPDGTRYLPDFWLPDQQAWVEIKGTREQMEADGAPQKLGELAAASGHPAFCFYGDCTYEDQAGCRAEICGSAWCFYRCESADGWSVGGDYDYRWCMCPTCGKVGIEYEGRAARLCECDGSDKGYNAGAFRIVDAYDAAKGYRFDPKGRVRREARQ